MKVKEYYKFNINALSDYGKLTTELSAISKRFDLQLDIDDAVIRNVVDGIRNQLVVLTKDRYKEILKAKRAETKRKRQQEKNELMRFFRQSAMQLVQIFNLMNQIVDAKLIIIRKLQEMRQVTGTFVRTDDGFKITNPEGFVAVDKLSGGALKLVDRLEFSHQNFTVKKQWDK